MYYDLSGEWQVTLDDGTNQTAQLPGTLDENGIGHKDKGENQWHPDENLGNVKDKLDSGAPIATRFTRKYTYEGQAKLTKRIHFIPESGKRVFLEVERARCLRLFVDGKGVKCFTQGTISTPYVFEVTGLLTGNNEITLLSDNSYPKLPHDDIVYSSAATDETQTNWNGVIGYLRLRVENSVFLSKVFIYPNKNKINVKIEISATKSYSGKLNIQSEALKRTFCTEIQLKKGKTKLAFDNLELLEDVQLWDEYEGNLYILTVQLTGADTKTQTFGVRESGENEEGRLALNGRTIFLRSEANCAEFPETGHPPMGVDKWIEILKLFKSYGINCMRFHSHCPPQAAFDAADQVGMMMQPELSHWNPRNAFESEESFEYYQLELKQLIQMLANHPSFVMLTFGNELWTGELGHTRMDMLLSQAHQLDATRLYANGSNPHYGTIGCDANSDFYTSQIFFTKDYPLRGTFQATSEKGKDEVRIAGYVNNQYPNAMTNYDQTMDKLRKTYQKPVFGFEVGQFEVLPDFDELNKFKGVSEPINYQLIKKRADELGLLGEWKKYVEATGELSRIGYREEIEAAMRTKNLSGISLLGLQDFPGQGTALVGMMNSHLEPKPFAFARPEEFQKFFRDQLPLVLLPKYTYEDGEMLEVEIQVANFGKTDLDGPIRFCLSGDNFQTCGELDKVLCSKGKITDAGRINLLLHIDKATQLELQVEIDEARNAYPVWVYPKVNPICPEYIYETEHFDERAKKVLNAGGKVYLSPRATKEAMPMSIQTQFTTDFWSVGTFPAQSGGMGQLIDVEHPIFRDFPTQTHTNWQWWAMASQRAVILPRVMHAIITEMDSYAYMRPMAQLIEWSCGKGKLLFSSMGLQNLQQYPEARALLSSIYRYMNSGEFDPKQEISMDVIEMLVK